MSSWFDAKNLTSFAKTALTEAQKTLDKALDIQDEEANNKLKSDVGAASAPPPPTKSSSALQLTNAASGNDADETSSTSSRDSLSSSKSSSKLSTAAMWGSFSGSYFQAKDLGASTKDPPGSSEVALENIEDEEEDTITTGTRAYSQNVNPSLIFCLYIFFPNISAF